VHYRRTRLLALACLATLCAAACSPSPVALGVFPSPPEVVPLEGRTGESLLLRHETGASHQVIADADGLRGPLLWDGSWEVLAGSEVLAVFEVGQGASRFEDCWPAEQASNVEPPVVACLQSSALGRASRPYGEAHAEFSSALAALEGRLGEGPADWYCFLGGEHLAAAAVLSGQDHAAMLERFESHCNFSLIHGVYMARTYLAPSLTEVCDHRVSYPLARIDHVSQCWNGVGMGLARLHRFAVAPIHEQCLTAPEPGAVKNCFEGALNYFYNYRFRVPVGSWGPPSIDARWCAANGAALGASGDFYDVCYRVAVRGLVADTADPLSTAFDFAAACRELPAAQFEGCMVAAGHLAARLVVDFRRPLTMVSGAVDVCRTGSGFYEPCLLRLFSGVVATRQSPSGFPQGELLPLVPVSHRSAVAGHLDRWLAATEGVGG
jgi:hypothetical protein